MTDRQTRKVKIRVAKAERSRTNNNNLICIAPACQVTSEALTSDYCHPSSGTHLILLLLLLIFLAHQQKPMLTNYEKM